MSAPAAAIVEMLRDQPDPLSLAALARGLGRHENTVREHLEALGRRGLVRRFRAEPSGRGRPAWLYERTAEPAENAYAGLAAALAATIARTSDRPGEEATTAGEAWGHELVRDRGVVGSGAEEARDLVVEMLGDLGFAPVPEEGDPSQVRLTRCPLLEAAHRHPDVVCGVHLGIVRGALAELGADPAGAGLEPFAEPGACRLVVPPVTGPRRASTGGRDRVRSAGGSGSRRAR